MFRDIAGQNVFFLVQHELSAAGKPDVDEGRTRPDTRMTSGTDFWNDDGGSPANLCPGKYDLERGRPR